MDTRSVIAAYFDAFNQGRTDRMLDLLDDGVEHHVNQGEMRPGKAMFMQFSDHMTACYRENLTDLVILTGDTPDRAAAEYTVNGTYLQTDAGLPEARGQTYRLPAGTFFTLRDGLITRITTCYNLSDWMRQVGAT